MITVRRVVINADDGGADAGVDAGLLESCRRGLVRSASVLANVDGAAAFVTEARQNGMGLGLHFNITEGLPLSDGGRALSHEGVAFSGTKAEVWRHACAGLLDRMALRDEVGAQWDALAAMGAGACHVDSHNHVHVYPCVLDAMLEALPRDRSLHIRIPWEDSCPQQLEPGFAEPRSSAQAMREKIEAAGHFAAPAFFGFRFSQAPTLACLAALRGTEASWCEWMAHPGKRAGSPFTSSDNRQLELDLLTMHETVTTLNGWGWQVATFEEVRCISSS